jgi:long-chain acyl-CoA synthetase
MKHLYPGGPIHPVPEYSSISDMLTSSAEAYSDKTFMIESDVANRSVNFTELDASVGSLARGILDSQEKPVVGIVGSNSIEWATAFLAVLRAGGIVVPIDKELPIGEILSILHFSRANILFFDETYSEDVSNSLKMHASPFTLITMNETEEYPFQSLEGLTEAGSRSNKALPESYDISAPALISYTSGTMGKAKGVVLSQGNLISDLRQMLQAVGLKHSEVFLSILPMHHMYECVCGFLCPLSHGCSIIFCRSLKNITEDMSRYKTTIMLGVPLLWEAIYRRVMAGILAVRGGSVKLKMGLAISAAGELVGAGRIRKKLFSPIHEKLGGRMEFLVSGGAGVDTDVVKGFEKLGFTFLQGYGLTECSPILAVNRDTANVAGSVGPPLPDVEIRIDDPDEDGVGEILGRGPNVMLGYHDNPEETKKVLSPDGWFRTGDFGYIDHHGFLFITGRKKNIIVAKNGKNVYPEEIEQTLARSRYFLETMVFGRASHQKGEEIWAIIVPDMDRFISEEEAEGEQISPEFLQSRVRTEITRLNRTQPVYRRVTKFILRSSELPKTTTKKVRRLETLKEAGLEQETAFKV